MRGTLSFIKELGTCKVDKVAEVTREEYLSSLIAFSFIFLIIIIIINYICIILRILILTIIDYCDCLNLTSGLTVGGGRQARQMHAYLTGVRVTISK